MKLQNFRMILNMFSDLINKSFKQLFFLIVLAEVLLIGSIPNAARRKRLFVPRDDLLTTKK